MSTRKATKESEPLRHEWSDRCIIEQMRAYIDLAWTYYQDRQRTGRSPISTLSEETGLSHTTATNLVCHITRYPRYMTLIRFGDACGLRLTWTKAGRPQMKLVG